MELDDILVTRKWVGQPTPRKEDLRLMKGGAAFVDDLPMDCYHAAILRSPYPHARICSIDVQRAEALPGVLAVLTGEEVAARTKPVQARAITRPAVQYVMAVGKVRYVGEPVAVVVAEDCYQAEDALEFVDVDYEPLPVVADIEAALQEDSCLIFEEAGSNVLMHDHIEHGDLAACREQADLVLKEKFRIPRYSSTPLEPCGIIVEHKKVEDELVIWSNDQQHGRSIVNLSHCLGVPHQKLRLIATDSGGSFGIKLALWPYAVLMALVARKVDKPVKWIQTRTGQLLAGSHAPDAHIEIELALRKDGTILALEMKDVQNDGSFIHTSGIYSLIKFANMVGCYNIRATRAELLSVVTNRSPSVQNRGVGKPAMNFVLERMVDLVAKKLGLDPAEIRRRNFVRPEQMPHTAPSGEVYESGNYPVCLDKALEQVGYREWKEKQPGLRKQGRYVGVGLSAGVEPGTSNLGYYYTSSGDPEYTGNAEGAQISIDFQGNASVLIGSVDSGQGHATTAAQVVADMLAIEPDQISVHTQADTLVSPFLGHSGVYSNKFNDVDLGAVIMATRKVRDKMVKIGASLLGLDSSQLVLEGGRMRGLTDAGKGVSFAEIAGVAYKQIHRLPEGVEPGLREIAYYKNPYAKPPSREDFNVQVTHSNSVHAVVTEVDIETGAVRFLRYVIVHDCGNQINPGVVEGMAIGSTVHGIGASLFEEFTYDEDGQLLCSNFINYLKPIADGLPRFEISTMTSPCPYTLLGTKSAGEGGSITSLAAIANSVEDALTPFGIKVTSLPMTPEKIMNAIGQGGEI